jgi:glucoamylase
LTGLGEPKFNVDATPFSGPWGRPQNDGPALRALSFIHWSQDLIKNGKIDFVRQRLYNQNATVIKKDLQYVAEHWREPSFDLWEEVKGDHFYTRMVQRRALKEGADLAEQMGDTPSAELFRREALEIEKTILEFWDADRGYFVATKNRVEGLDYKNANLDTAVILGLIHGSMNDGFLSFSDPRVQSTMNHLIESFRQTFPINGRAEIPGVAIGRYPEDRYGGNHFNGGNPWPLCTLAVAEVYYRAATELRAKGDNNGATDMIAKGDEFVARVQYHAHADGALNEQIDRNNGYMTSVEDLTWNYAAILTSSQARKQAVQSQQLDGMLDLERERPVFRRAK